MRSAYSLAHVQDDVLLRDLAALVARETNLTAVMLAHIGEVDARRLYVAAGHASMFVYCVEELRLSEDAAYTRITAARAARQFPALFEAVAEGRLHLTAVRMLAPHLTAENGDALVAEAAGLRKSGLEAMLARRFGRPDAPTLVNLVAVPPARALRPLVPGRAASERPLVPERVAPTAGAPAGGDLFADPAPAEPPASNSPASAPAQRSTATEDVVLRYRLHVTIERKTRDKLKHAQALLRHAVPSGDVAEVLDRALAALIDRLEKRKFGGGGGGGGGGGDQARPRAMSKESTRRRHVPARVRRAVWKRDQGRCTFVGPTGRRCGARGFLEFDHVVPVARGGGAATLDDVRLRCRAHNRLEAERALGEELASRRRGPARPKAPAPAPVPAPPPPPGASAGEPAVR